MNRCYYSASIQDFLAESEHSILGKLIRHYPFQLEQTQNSAWQVQIDVLKRALNGLEGTVYFEYAIPRMGRRADVVLVIKNVLFILEFKVGQSQFLTADSDQVLDYALDLKNFHETSHNQLICPILVATNSHSPPENIQSMWSDGVINVQRATATSLSQCIDVILNTSVGQSIDAQEWEGGSYRPTPTIIEAARALFGGHSVKDITRNDAGKKNIEVTSVTVSKIIEISKRKREKAICFVTGVPGAGKTLVGLDIAKNHSDEKSELYSVYLSGNAPLVAVLHEALARDRVQKSRSQGEKVKKGDALRDVKALIQIVHHFRDECLRDPKPPIEHVALFDEAQRAWNLEQTASFMKRKKGIADFDRSEPDFLISCLDRHPDWAVVVCLVGGGQEINTGEAGITAWLDSIAESHPDWKVYVSPNLSEDYPTGDSFAKIRKENLHTVDELHLSTSIRSFRAENVSSLVKHILDLDVLGAREQLELLSANYPIKLTRDIGTAKEWIRNQARGSERTGIMVSSQAERLRPQGIHVKAPMNPVHWFLGPKDDVRSSYYLEDVATEFAVQGLEIDWACITWDADMRYRDNGWEHWSFKGNKWQRINQEVQRRFQINAYRVLMTRARQGMVLVVPEGDDQDHTRAPQFYNKTFDYLASIGFEQI